MQKLEKIMKCAVIGIFAVVLLIPLLAFHREDTLISVLENKMAATRPDVSAYSLTDKALPQAWDTYFSDRIGMKEECVLSDIAIMHRLFNRIDVPLYTMGKDGNIFYLPDNAIASYQGTDLPTEEEHVKIQEEFDKISAIANRDGYSVLFMPIPNKEQYYGEYMPDGFRFVSESYCLHEVQEYLMQHAAIPVVDVESALDAHLKDDGELLYYRNIDATHWNSYGAFWGYQALMEKIRQTDSSLPYLGPEDVDIQKETCQKALKSLQSYPIISRAFSDLEDIQYTITPKDGFHGVEDNSVPVGFSCADDSSKLYYHWHNDAVDNDKTLLIYGDSYIYSFLLPLLSESFRDVYFLSTGEAMEVGGELISMIDPDVVVLELVARMINGAEGSLYTASKWRQMLDYRTCPTASYDPQANTVTITFKPDADYTQVWFPTWSEENGQDDIVWYEAEKQEDGSWICSVDASIHGSGKYIIHFYADQTSNDGYLGSFSTIIE